MIEEILSKYKIKEKGILEVRLIGFREKLERMKELYVEGDINKSDYNIKSAELKTKIQYLEEEIDSINNFNSYYNEIDQLKNDYIDILNSFKVKLENGEAEEVLKNHIEYIVVGKNYDTEKEKIISTVEEIKFKDFAPLYKILDKAEFMTSGIF